jgi:hypothetical protein
LDFYGFGNLRCCICHYQSFTPNVNLSLYGFSSNTAFSGIGAYIIAIMIFKGFAAYSLWFEKSNAISIGKIDAICGGSSV